MEDDGGIEGGTELILLGGACIAGGASISTGVYSVSSYGKDKLTGSYTSESEFNAGLSESAFRGASAGATVFGIAVCPPAGAAAAQLAGGGTAAAASAGAVDTLVSVIPQIIGIEAAAEMLAQAGKAMLSKPPDGGDAAGGEEEGVYIENGEKVPEDINFDDKQLGKKWGKHKTDYPNMKDYTEYKQYARDVFDKPDKIIYDSKNQEYLYIKGDDLLRVGENGDFISLYDGAESARVTNAITEGGTLWP